MQKNQKISESLNIKQFKDLKGHHILIPSTNDTKLSNINSRWFDASYWQSKDSILGESKGRNTTWLIKAPQSDLKDKWVLRHYYRGGLVSKISKDSYIFHGIRQSRCYREVELLQQMLKMQLPVPRPVAARVIQQGIFYSADLLMEKLDAEDLVKKLKESALSKDQWLEIGKTVALFHQKGIFHADLNAHNIMIADDQKVWLIDFDRCSQKHKQGSWQKSNIERLHRSFIKEKNLFEDLNFEQENWQDFKEGYSNLMNSIKTTKAGKTI